MDMYNVSGHGNAEAYLIQGAESSPLLTNPHLEQIEAMYNEGAPDYVVDQGMYYPTTTNYGYYCTGLESPGEWEDHHRIFGLDGPDIQYAGAQSESLPYVYYTPSYGYAQSPYNPYNPYIPGAMIGVDSPFVGAQQYYTLLSYQNPASSPAYIPFVVEPDIIPNSSSDLLLDTGTSIANRPEGRALKHSLSSASAAFPRNPPKHASNQTNPLSKVSERPRSNVGPSKQSAAHGSVSSGTFSSAASSHVLQGRNSSDTIQVLDNISNGHVLSHRSQLKVSLPVGNGLSDFGSSAHGQAAVDKFRPKIHFSRAINDVNGSPDALGEQNRGPRTNRLKNQLAVKTYTTKAGDSNMQGNITIHTDQYNKDDFPIDYVNGKFFVIKSYSEDDVHKSIKYNVWSSTPHGNKKLESAYADAQRIAAGKPRGCPIFLFFSVNASGQFCGVAEMIGPVDYHRDMDFWQQDKWSGSFPVKWHIIKDVPNTNFRHIILENNENKPVTNSRDTQEIMYRQGMEMLKIFKNHTSTTSLLDDFMYYENRQKIMQEEKARMVIKNFESPIFLPALDTPRKLNSILELPPTQDEKITKDQNSSKKTLASPTEKASSDSDAANASISNENTEQISVEAKDVIKSTLKIGSLSISPKQDEHKPLTAAIPVITNTEPPVNVVTVGSMPVKVNGSAESRFLTVGTIPLDPKALQLDKGGRFANSGSQNY